MNSKDLKKYCNIALGKGATTAKIINPSTVVTAPWVRLKYQFGCGGYGYSYCCPPHTPTAEETRIILDSYKRALLFHIETSLTLGREKHLMKYCHSLIDLEGEIFKDGYYKAFVLLAGSCDLRRECGILTKEPCNNRYREAYDRMPVIVPRDKEALWIELRTQHLKELESVLKPYPSEEMKMVEVAAWDLSD